MLHHHHILYVRAIWSMLQSQTIHVNPCRLRSFWSSTSCLLPTNFLVQSLHLGWRVRFPRLLCSILYRMIRAYYLVYATEPDHTCESMPVATLHVCLRPFTGTGGSREPPVPCCSLAGKSKQAADDKTSWLTNYWQLGLQPFTGTGGSREPPVPYCSLARQV